MRTCNDACSEMVLFGHGGRSAGLSQAVSISLGPLLPCDILWLQDGFAARHLLDYHHGQSDENKAILVGNALVKGYKAFLDVKQKVRALVRSFVLSGSLGDWADSTFEKRLSVLPEKARIIGPYREVKGFQIEMSTRMPYTSAGATSNKYK